jgi:hypothetical protein
MASKKIKKGMAPGDFLRLRITMAGTNKIKPDRKRTVELMVNLNSIQ